MVSAYGFGVIGKIIGPLGLALIVGSSNYLKPDVPLPQIPVAFLYLGCWLLMAGAVYYFSVSRPEASRSSRSTGS